MKSPTRLVHGKVVPASAEDIRQAEVDEARWRAEAPRRALIEEIQALRKRKAELLDPQATLLAERDALAAEVAALEAT